MTDLDFDELFVTAYPRILGYAFHNPLCTDFEDARDIASETFARAWAARGRYQDNGHEPIAWLYTIVHNIMRDRADHVERVNRPFRFRLNNAHDDHAEHVAQHIDTECALEQLTNKQRLAVVERFWNDHEYKEIARSNGLATDSAAVKLVQRAISRLQRKHILDDYRE